MLSFPPGDVTFRDGRRPEAAVRVTPIGVFEGPQTKVVAPSEVTSAIVLARPDDRPVVVLHGARGAILARVGVADLAEGRAVVAELGLKERAPRFAVARALGSLSYRTLSRVFAGLLFFAVVTVLKGLLPIPTGIAIVAFAVALLLVVRWRQSRTIAIGDDGVLVQSTFAHVFATHAAVHEVALDGNWLTLRLLAEEHPFVVPTHGIGEDLVATLRAHRAVHEAFAPPSFAERFAEGEHAAAPASYRTASTPEREEAWATLEHPLVPLATRIAAALSAAPSTPAEMERLSRVAARSVSPVFRDALEAVERGDATKARTLMTRLANTSGIVEP